MRASRNLSVERVTDVVRHGWMFGHLQTIPNDAWVNKKQESQQEFT